MPDSALYSQHVANGRCGLCGGAPARGRKLCLGCAADRRLNSQRYRGQHDAAGLCPSCSSPRVEGKAACQVHLDADNARPRRISKWRDDVGIA